MCFIVFFFQAEDGIRDLVRSRGLGDVYKRQVSAVAMFVPVAVIVMNVEDVMSPSTTARVSALTLSLIHI